MPATNPPHNQTDSHTDNHTNSVQITPKYNLMTALAMLVGIVIGSGIFFKADNVLQHTGGSVSLGIVVFILAAIAIIFGSLTIAQLASRSDNHGGIIAYADEFVGPEFFVFSHHRRGGVMGGGHLFIATAWDRQCQP